MTRGCSPPVFDEAFRERLTTLIAWRRDVRRFSDRPVPEPLIETLLDIAQLSPSVGNSQPWRWVQVTVRQSAPRSVRSSPAAMMPPDWHSRTSGLCAYASLKLEGLDRAPLQFAIFCDQATGQGFGLGRHTMPEMLEYSTVAMVSTFWLAARAADLGVGWISILDPQKVCRVLDAPPQWKLVAYLCVGWPETNHLDPELERFGWQCRTSAGRQIEIR